MACKNPENHSHHICQMKIQQRMDDIKALKKDATHFCKQCEAPSNKPEHLCAPRAYIGRPGVLKWKE